MTPGTVVIFQEFAYGWETTAHGEQITCQPIAGDVALYLWELNIGFKVHVLLFNGRQTRFGSEIFRVGTVAEF